VSRATLHNFDEIGRLDAKIGDHVYVEKSGEIIPKVLGVAKDKRNGSERAFRAPKECPVCGSRLVSAPDEVAVRCENVACPAQIKETVRHFASRNAMDIEGLGEATVNMLVDRKMITDYGDIYYLKYDDVKALERMAEKSAGNLMQAVEKSKCNDLHRLIFGLGIRHVGERAAWVLAGNFGSVDALEKATRDELTAVREIGPVMADSIYKFFRAKENLAVLKKLKSAGVRMSQARTVKKGGRLEGKTVVVTGTLKTFSRTGIEEAIRRNGGNASSSVSGSTSFVVAGEEAGSKLAKAKALGIRVITEEEFKEMIG
jgi:DNA ligase (NAD+)